MKSNKPKNKNYIKASYCQMSVSLISLFLFILFLFTCSPAILLRWMVNHINIIKYKCKTKLNQNRYWTMQTIHTCTLRIPYHHIVQKFYQLNKTKKMLDCFTALYNINYLFYSYRKKKYHTNRKWTNFFSQN